LTKLALFSPPLGVEGFAHEYHVKWTKSLGVHVQPLPVFRIQYIKKDRSHRSFLPWKSVVQTPETDTVNFFEDIYEQNRPLAAQNIECKEKQNQIAKKCKADEDAQQPAPRKWMPHPELQGLPRT
jgi:hypothetical protein